MGAAEIHHAAGGHWADPKGCKGCGNNEEYGEKYHGSFPKAAFCLACAEKAKICAICGKALGDKKEAEAKKPPACPDCKKTDAAVPIVYGEPTEEGMDREKRGEIVQGGCRVTDNDPRWACRACAHRWGRPKGDPPPAPPACPDCRKADAVVPVVYGCIITPEQAEREKQGEIYISEDADQPPRSWHCKTCKKRW